MIETVRKLLAKQLEITPESIGPETDIIEELGADSLDVVELIMALEEELGFVVTDEGANQLRTVKEVADFIEKRAK